MRIGAQKLRALINNTQAAEGKKGTFFRVVTRKRSTGKTRTFVCNFNYKKYLRGGEPAYDFDVKNLVPVWDQEAYLLWRKGEAESPLRSINCDDVIELCCAGIYLVRDGEQTPDFERYV